MYTYQYPHPAVTVDIVVFGLDDGELKLLLIRRGLEPFAGSWALPGGFIKMDETLEVSARRELEEETGVRDLYLEQLGTYGDPGRDPRERVITVAYFAIVNLFDHPVKADTDAAEARWWPVSSLPSLAFDHDKIIAEALERLRGKIRYRPLAFEFLPTRFTLTQIQSLYEVILGEPQDKRNFRKKLLASGLLVPLEEVLEGVAHRAPQLFRFDKSKYEDLLKQGKDFSL